MREQGIGNGMHHTCFVASAIQHSIYHRSHSRARPRLCVDSGDAAIWLHYAVWGSFGEGTIHIHVFTFSDGGCFHTQLSHRLSHTQLALGVINAHSIALGDPGIRIPGLFPTDHAGSRGGEWDTSYRHASLLSFPRSPTTLCRFGRRCNLVALCRVGVMRRGNYPRPFIHFQ